MLWSAARALGWSPFDRRLQSLSILQLEWAILMANPELKEEAADARLSDRDTAAVLVLEWMREHVTRG